MKRKQTRLIALLFCALLLTLSACGATQSADLPPTTQTAENNLTETEKETMEQPLRLWIDSTEVHVAWENNKSVQALRDLAAKSPLRIKTSIYGGFEQVGSLGAALAHEDRRITTKPGDIMLYSGDQIVLFFGKNTWSYTPLGRIIDQSEKTLTALLGNGQTTLTISLEDIE